MKSLIFAIAFGFVVPTQQAGPVKDSEVKPVAGEWALGNSVIKVRLKQDGLVAYGMDNDVEVDLPKGCVVTDVCISKSGNAVIFLIARRGVENKWQFYGLLLADRSPTGGVQMGESLPYGEIDWPLAPSWIHAFDETTMELLVQGGLDSVSEYPAKSNDPKSCLKVNLEKLTLREKKSEAEEK